MRLWLVDPKLMCDHHLLGEHVECHMAVGILNSGVSVKGYVAKGLLDSTKIVSRHAELVAEMERRGMVHQTPLIGPITRIEGVGAVSPTANLIELQRRCPTCAERINSRSRLG